MADRIFANGKIWTGNESLPWTKAVAVRGNRILAVGTNQESREAAGGETEILDLGGALVVPGFIDSHVHFLDGGFSLLSLQLREAKSRQEFVARIAENAKSLPRGEWILRGDWDHEQFTPAELPRKEWIDAVTPENPVFINRLDGHMALANGLALRMAGITQQTSVPPGGEIVKDPATGEPTGILKDAAMDLVYGRIPAPTAEQKIRAAEAALKLASENGVIGVHDMSAAASFEVYEELLKRGRLTTRIFLYIPVTEADIYARLMLRTPFGNELLKIGGLKGFADGSLGAATACFFEPYADDPEAFGLLHGQMFPPGIMEKRVLEADRSGLQVAIHAIGDRANALILDIYEKVESESGRRDRRFRIEHAQHLRPSDILRFGKLGIIASVQPYHLSDDGGWAERKIGPERAKFAYPFKSLLDSGAILAFGSDWPVAPLDPIAGISAAVTRRTLDGKNPGGWIPGQKISLDDAVRGFTRNGAYAEFAERIKGTIEPGKLADFVVLDRNLWEIPAEDIGNARVIMTVFDGRIIFKR
jgi:predicted amidohydrolase YtcJ